MKNTWEEIFKKVDQIEGWLVSGQERALYKLATEVPQNGVVVEIGSFKGRSTACLALGRRHRNIKIYAIDTFRGNGKDFYRGNQFRGSQFLTTFKKNMGKLDLKNIMAVQGFSQDIGREWKKAIDLLFIDGSHIYEDVKKDFELFYPWVKPGGLVLLHDVNTTWPGVSRVWHELVKYKLTGLNNCKTLYFGRKPNRAWLWSLMMPAVYVLRQSQYRWNRIFYCQGIQRWRQKIGWLRSEN